MALAQITDHVAQALAALAEQYKGKPRVEGLLTAFVNQVQKAENALFDLLGTNINGLGTNLLSWSQDLSNAVWTQTNMTATANAGAAPDGTTTATQLSATANFGNTFQTVFATLGAPYVFSIWVKTAAGTVAGILGLSGAANVNFTATTTWQRISIASPALLSAFPSPDVVINTSGQSLLVWGGQFCPGTDPGIYRATTTSALVGLLNAAVLDRLGRIVGEPRSGRSDPSYLVALRAKILLNLSSGTVEEIYAIFALVTAGTGVTLRVREWFPKAFTLEMGTAAVGDATAADYALLLRRAKDAGAKADLLYGNTTPFFGFDGNGSGFDTGYLGGTT